MARQGLSVGRQPRGRIRALRCRHAGNCRKRREPRVTARAALEKILRQIENVRGRRRPSSVARFRRRRWRNCEYYSMNDGKALESKQIGRVNFRISLRITKHIFHNYIYYSFKFNCIRPQIITRHSLRALSIFSEIKRLVLVFVKLFFHFCD